MQLAAALQPLAQFKQFVLCRIDPAPKPGAPWKTNKVPLDPAGFIPGDAQSPKNWLDAETAFTLATRAGGNYGVGFVITRDDPVWCLDLDDCLMPDGTWSPEAQHLCAAFPGAAVELSDSGHGLHIWGCGRAPNHDKKRGNLEFYTELRFMALGRQGLAHGQLWLDWTPTGRLDWLVSNFFPPAANDSGDVGDPLSDAPVPEWRGPADDAELLRRALRSQSAAGIFGGKASFADLWECNVEALARAFPSPKGDQFDRSSADQALASHLAFWTGCHGERVERLMRQSALKRDKWDERGDYYMRRTINPVCQPGRQVLVDKELVVQPPPTEGESAPAMRLIEGTTFLSGTDQLRLFEGFVYIVDVDAVFTPQHGILNKERFNNLYSNYTFAISGDNKATDEAWKAFVRSKIYFKPTAPACCFKPGKPYCTFVDTGGGKQALNVYEPLNIRRVQGDVSPFLDLMAKLFPDQRDRELITSYMAAIVQHQGVKFKWAPLIQGTPGNGKSTLSKCVTYAVGKQYAHPTRASELDSRFNDWLFGKVFYSIEDVYSTEATRDKMFESLKPMITEEWAEIEGKQLRKVSRDLCGNFIFNSNHKNALRKTRDDRRIAVFYTAQQSEEDLHRDGMDEGYFHRLVSWFEQGDGWAKVAEYLHTYPIPDAMNPAKLSLRAPRTTSYDEAIREGRGAVEQEILECIDQEEKGFRGGWISSHYLGVLITKMGKADKIPHNRRSDLVRSLGYEAHPGLPHGKVNNRVQPDGTKPFLYVRKGHPDRGLKGAAVEHAYTSAQAFDGTVNHA